MAAQFTKVSVQIGKPAREFRDLKTYSIDSNVLTLVDCASFQIINPAGANNAKIKLGDPVKVMVSDPRVDSGRDTKILTGLVVGVTREADENGGSVWNIEAADLGWHLVNNCGPLFKSVLGITFQKLLDLSIDPSWGFGSPSRTENNLNRNLMQGKATIQAPTTSAYVPLPPICFEAGDTIADKLILYAKRARYLVNVSADGYLQIFRPNYGVATTSQGPIDPYSAGVLDPYARGLDFTLNFHRPTETARQFNNVKKASLRESIDGVYTNITCVGTIVNLTYVGFAKGDQHPGTFRGYYTNKDALPFKRTLTMSDGDAGYLAQDRKGVDPKLSHNAAATDRAIQKGQRGLFDSWTMEYTVEGHVMGGHFIAPDTMCGVDDSINDLKGNFYISARRLARSASGTLTTITVRKPNLLHGGQ